MCENESLFKRFCKRCVNKLQKLVKEYGISTILIIGVSFIAIILLFFSLGSIETNVKIGRMKESIRVEEETEIPVIREGQLEEGFSLDSIIVDGFISFSSEAEAVSTFVDMVEACENMTEKNEKLIVPESAGTASLGNIIIYMWSRSGERLLTKKEFKEIHAILIMGDGYVYVVLDANLIGFGTTIETGRLAK